MILCLIVGGATAQPRLLDRLSQNPLLHRNLGWNVGFRGLTLALLGGNSIDLCGTISTIEFRVSSRFTRQTGFRITSMAIGALVAVAMFTTVSKETESRKHGFQGVLRALVLENLIISGLVLYLSYQLASYKVCQMF
jgi:ABC-type xylose transport system permease subunit